MTHIANEKVVFVTGAASGLGKATTERFLRDGYKAVATDVAGDALDACVKEWDAADRVLACQADVRNRDEIQNAGDATVKRWGRIDVLGNNAGSSGPTGPVESLDYADWRRTIEVNLDSQFLCTKQAVPMRREAGGGSLVNISSSAGLRGYPMRTPYAAAKWGVIGLTKTLAMELGPEGIRVNAICPGSGAGDRIDRVIEAAAEARGVGAETVRQGYLRQVSMRTFVSAEDVAELALFLCSEAGARISGQALAVDGHTEGLSMPEPPGA